MLDHEFVLFFTIAFDFLGLLLFSLISRVVSQVQALSGIVGFIQSVAQAKSHVLGFCVWLINMYRMMQNQPKRYVCIIMALYSVCLLCLFAMGPGFLWLVGTFTIPS